MLRDSMAQWLQILNEIEGVRAPSWSEDEAHRFLAAYHEHNVNWIKVLLIQ